MSVLHTKFGIKYQLINLVTWSKTNKGGRITTNNVVHAKTLSEFRNGENIFVFLEIQTLILHNHTFNIALTIY